MYVIVSVWYMDAILSRLTSVVSHTSIVSSTVEHALPGVCNMFTYVC